MNEDEYIRRASKKGKHRPIQVEEEVQEEEAEAIQAPLKNMRYSTEEKVGCPYCGNMFVVNVNIEAEDYETVSPPRKEAVVNQTHRKGFFSHLSKPQIVIVCGMGILWGFGVLMLAFPNRATMIVTWLNHLLGH